MKRGREGPASAPPNPKLKMLLLTTGLRPVSSPNILAAYRRQYYSICGARRKGVVYLVDARLEELQFETEATDPDACGSWAKVAYVREPDVPGGSPVLDGDGAVRLKTQAEMYRIDRAHPVHYLRHCGHYSRGYLEALCPSDDDDEEFPVTVAYLWNALTDGVGATTPHESRGATIFVGEGTYSRAKGFVARRATDGAPFCDADYERGTTDPSRASHFFRAATGSEFRELVAQRRAVYATGGVPWLTVATMQPDFVVDGVPRKDLPNAYARAVLDAVRDGELIWVGNSAGACAMSYALGPLTADGTARMVRPNAPYHDYGARGELGIKWLYPGIGEYVGVPHRLVFRPHITFDANYLGYQGRALAATRSLSNAASAPSHDLWACLLCDYDFDGGASDAFEISAGRCTFHVGKCATAPFALGDDLRAELAELGRDHASCAPDGKLARQPTGVPKAGFSFEWKPSDGEIICAGPHTTDDIPPFRLYADEYGPLMDAPPTYAVQATETPRHFANRAHAFFT